MGGSPPPPPPEPQPRESAKEDSMYWRNRSYDEAVTASKNSYSAAVTIKALADLLLPITDEQLRKAIDEHYQIVNEYRKAQTIYTTTVRTFIDVDLLIRAAIEKLSSIRQIGETHVNEFDKTVIQYITENIQHLYKQQSEIQKLYVKAAAELAEIKKTYMESVMTTDEKQAIYDEKVALLRTDCANATAIYVDIAGRIGEMSTRIDNDGSLTTANGTRPVVSQTVDDTQVQLRDVTKQILKNYTTNIDQYKKELERASKWYSYYNAKANLVRDRNRVVIDPAVFRRLLDLAKSAHMNAVYSAIYAVSANKSAYTDRNVVGPR